MTTAKVTVLIRVQPSVKAALKKVAIAEDRSVAWVVERAIAEWLDREERRKKNPRA
jgi:predicted transcriptional regulator